MEPGGEPLKFKIEIDRLATDLHRMSEKLETEPRKRVIIVAELSAGYDMECRMLENNPAGLNMAENERAVGNQYYRLLKGAVYTVWIFICICMSLSVFLFAKKMKFLT